MTRAGVAYYEREQRDLVRINHVEPTRSPLSAASGDALGHVGYFAELIDEWAPEAHADERLYRLGASMTDAVAAGAPVEPLARYFEYWLLRLQGVYPSLLACPGCAEPLLGGAVMPARDDIFVCPACAPAGGTSVGIEALKFLKAAGATAPDRLGELPLHARAGRELETIHRRLLNLHLEKDLKSARVLREMRHAR
jgi:DNA repair protein RecO